MSRLVFGLCWNPTEAGSSTVESECLSSRRDDLARESEVGAGRHILLCELPSESVAQIRMSLPTSADPIKKTPHRQAQLPGFG